MVGILRSWGIKDVGKELGIKDLRMWVMGSLGMILAGGIKDHR